MSVGCSKGVEAPRVISMTRWELLTFITLPFFVFLTKLLECSILLNNWGVNSELSDAIYACGLAYHRHQRLH